jgi:hypothetical protein
MSAPPLCRHARLAIGGDPQHLPADVQAHVAGCPDCTRFRDETLAMEAPLKAALELPLHRFRTAAAAPAPEAPARQASPFRRYALAASLLLAVLVGAGTWFLLPQTALASDLVAHVVHEADSWNQQQPISRERLAEVLARAGMSYDSRLPVVYASPCPFRGHVVPHLVVKTDQGPVTVMLLAHETGAREGRFSEGGYHGTIVRAGAGSIAVLTPEGRDFDGALAQVLAGVR